MPTRDAPARQNSRGTVEPKTEAEVIRPAFSKTPPVSGSEVTLLSLGFAELLDAIADTLVRRAAAIRTHQSAGECDELIVHAPGAAADRLSQLLPEHGAMAVGKFTLTPDGGRTREGRPTFKCTSVDIGISNPAHEKN